MKKFFVLISFAFILGNVKGQKPPSNAEEVLKEACELAAKENKKVFVIFTASWCGWCKRMDKSIADSVCSDFFSNNYVIRHLVVDEAKDKLNLENPGAKELRAKYHGDGEGIPFWLVFDKQGNMLADSKMRKEDEGPEKGENTGCPASEKEVAYFISVLQKTSGITSQQVETIRKRFRENDK